MQFAGIIRLALSPHPLVVHVRGCDERKGALPILLCSAEREAGLGASKEMVDYWENMFKTAPEISTKGLLTAVAS